MTLTFLHSGGDVIWSGDYRTPLNDGDLDYLARIYRDECIAALAAGDDPAFEASKALMTELFKALAERRDWRRCASAPRHSDRKAA